MGLVSSPGPGWLIPGRDRLKQAAGFEFRRVVCRIGAASALFRASPALLTRTDLFGSGWKLGPCAGLARARALCAGFLQDFQAFRGQERNGYFYSERQEC